MQVPFYVCTSLRIIYHKNDSNTFFASSSMMIPNSRKKELWYRCSIFSWAPWSLLFSAPGITTNLSSNHQIVQKTASLMRVECCTNQKACRQQLGASLLLSPFSIVIALIYSRGFEFFLNIFSCIWHWFQLWLPSWEVGIQLTLKLIGYTIMFMKILHQDSCYSSQGLHLCKVYNYIRHYENYPIRLKLPGNH